MGATVNPKDFVAAATLEATDQVPLHQTGGWRSLTLAALEQWLDLHYAPVGDGAEAVAAHLMELDPHTQYLLGSEAPTRASLGIAAGDLVEFSNVIITIGGVRRKFALDSDMLLILEEV